VLDDRGHAVGLLFQSDKPFKSAEDVPKGELLYFVYAIPGNCGNGSFEQASKARNASIVGPLPAGSDHWATAWSAPDRSGGHWLMHTAVRDFTLAGPPGNSHGRYPLGLSTALVERELVGGECAYWACIPSKTLLRPPEVRFEAQPTAGNAAPEQSWSGMAEYRDFMIRYLDDRNQVDGDKRDGASVYKSAARFTGRRRVEVDGAQLESEPIIVATGSDPAVPDIPGLRAKPPSTRSARAWSSSGAGRSASSSASSCAGSTPR
jgi:hypothetical protein